MKEDGVGTGREKRYPPECIFYQTILFHEALTSLVVSCDRCPMM